HSLLSHTDDCVHKSGAPWDVGLGTEYEKEVKIIPDLSCWQC
ncbi:unnamed protein product, partial [Allacma fusca]